MKPAIASDCESAGDKGHSRSRRAFTRGFNNITPTRISALAYQTQVRAAIAFAKNDCCASHIHLQTFEETESFYEYCTVLYCMCDFTFAIAVVYNTLEVSFIIIMNDSMTRVKIGDCDLHYSIRFECYLQVLSITYCLVVQIVNPHPGLKNSFYYYQDKCFVHI